jgi:hypothetical protein
MSVYRSIVRSVALVSILFVAAGPAAAAVCGDVNGDDQVLTGDALNVLRKAVGQPVTLDCPLEDELETCELNLDVWQPVPCPCVAGPGSLDAILQDNVTGDATPLYLGECSYVDDDQSIYFGMQSDPSYPKPGVSGDGKCHVSIEATASYVDLPYRCAIKQGIDESDIDCDTHQVFPPVSLTITQGQALGCWLQIEKAAASSAVCAH